MRFFIGLHHPGVAWPFRSSVISVNELRRRKRPFRVNDWILDSGAFSQISKHGQFLMSVENYAKQIEYWSQCGRLLAAVSQDWMCEEFVLKKTAKTIREHQRLTVENYFALQNTTEFYIMPVLQGYQPQHYVQHLEDYGELLKPNAWVGVGSVCKRNSNPDAVEDVLLAVKRVRPDLRLHGFGLKIEALERPTIRALLESSDSMAWSYDGRRNHDSNDPRDALRYAAKVEKIIDRPCLIQEQLFQWWS